MRFELFIRRVLWNKAEKTVNRFNTKKRGCERTIKFLSQPHLYVRNYENAHGPRPYFL